MESIVARRMEFEELIETLGEELQRVAERTFTQAIERAGITLTGELRAAFQQSVLHIAEDMSAWVEFSFGKYGRFKDVKYLEYANGWDSVNNKGKKYSGEEWADNELPEVVQAMIRYIREIGLDKFKYIPGYKNAKNKLPTTNRAIRRLAWTLAAARLRKGRIRNKKQKQWYAKSMGAIINEVQPLIAQRMGELLTNGHYTRLWEESVG